MPEGTDKPEAFLGHKEQRAAEQTWLQGQERPDREARERVNEYERIIPVLERHIRELDRRMQEMRAAGVPDPKSYDRLREQLSEVHRKTTELQQAVGRIANGVTQASPWVAKRAEEVQQRLLSAYERIEDEFSRALTAHDVWLKQEMTRTRRVDYGRRENDFGEFHKRLLPVEKYEEKVREMMDMVAALESQAELFEHKKRLTADVAQDLVRQVDDIHEQLQKLDEDTFDPAASRERRSLVHMMNALRGRLVKAAYAMASYDLSESQRREMRSSIARLTALTRESRPPLAERIQFAVARAERRAPKLADEVLKAR